MTTENIEAWDALAKSHESTTPLNFCHLLRPVSDSARILEVGCGYGRILSYLKNGLNPSFLCGVDFSVGMLRRARDAGHGNLVSSTASLLPFRDDSFDCVICVATLSSIPYRKDRKCAVVEMLRVLKPGGVLFLRDFLITLSPKRFIRYLKWGIILGRVGNFRSIENVEFHHFTRNELLGPIREQGIRDLRVTVESFRTMHGNISKGVTISASKE